MSQPYRLGKKYSRAGGEFGGTCIVPIRGTLGFWSVPRQCPDSRDPEGGGGGGLVVVRYLLLLLQCSLLPGGIILQGVLLLQGYMSVCACHYG
jgi:hypothetical protein